MEQDLKENKVQTMGFLFSVTLTRWMKMEKGVNHFKGFLTFLKIVKFIEKIINYSIHHQTLSKWVKEGKISTKQGTNKSLSVVMEKMFNADFNKLSE